LRVLSLVPYLIGGAVMWYLMLKSGVHATIAGVLLAFTIPFSNDPESEDSPSHYLEHLLHKPVAFIILRFSRLPIQASSSAQIRFKRWQTLTKSAL
jgi:NhaA family Na+:H+ antiporter